jgi:hypothetical protein
MLVILVYMALTLFSASFQQEGIVGLIQAWFKRTENVFFSHGRANIHKLFSALGIGSLLIALGIWPYLHRKVDIWILIGVSALTAHFLAHHRSYDDLVIVLPMISLFRISKGSECFECSNYLAVILFIGMWAMLLFVPGKLISSPSFATLLIESFQVIIMIATLVFLLYVAWLDKKSLIANQPLSLQFENQRN